MEVVSKLSHKQDGGRTDTHNCDGDYLHTVSLRPGERVEAPDTGQSHRQTKWKILHNRCEETSTTFSAPTDT
ncbi:hypothetical protein C5B87_11945 [Haloferax sp. Atlit-16N]|nr:hypothetical protein C5B87_11945 [Haloferax sp. Atlit-16N]